MFSANEISLSWFRIPGNKSPTAEQLHATYRVVETRSDIKAEVLLSKKKKKKKIEQILHREY